MKRKVICNYFAETPEVLGVIALFHGKRDPAVLQQRLQ